MYFEDLNWLFHFALPSRDLGLATAVLPGAREVLPASPSVWGSGYPLACCQVAP
jgi:hypothetical protein